MMNKLNHTSIIRFAIGTIFIAGAILKLYPIVPFEILLVKINVSNWFWVPFISRAIIVFELTLGLFIILKLKLKFTYYLSLLTLLGFTIFLFYLKYYLGHDENCGCFGSIIQIKPIESIIKNILLAGLIIYSLIKEEFSPIQWKFYHLLYYFIPLLGLTTPLILNPINLPEKEGNYVVKEGQIINDSSLIALPFNTGDTLNLLNGKKLVCFMSMKCKACKFTASKLSALNKSNGNSLSIYIIFLDSKERTTDLSLFLKETDAYNLPFAFFNDKQFFRISDASLPFLMYLNNGEIMNLTNYNDMHPDMVMEFFGK